MQPHKCPVCEGRGNVPPNFYTRGDGVTSTSQIICQSCHGAGVLWEAYQPVVVINPPAPEFNPYWPPKVWCGSTTIRPIGTFIWNNANAAAPAIMPMSVTMRTDGS